MEELDLKQLFEMFWSRKIYVTLIVLVAIFAGLIYTFFFVDPVYKSEARLLLVKQDTSSDSKSGITTTDLTLNQKLVSTYTELIKSPIVLKDVINNLGINMTESKLSGSISVSTFKDTEIITIRVANSNPENAQIIANEVVNVFSEKVKEIYKIDNVNVVGEPEVETAPYNINHVKDLLIFAAGGLVVAAAYVLIANMLDTTVKGKDDLEKKLKISVLTEIPLCDFNNDIKISGKGGKR